MGMSKDVRHFTCDRCGDEKYYESSDTKGVETWTNIHRYALNDTPVDRWLCSACKKEYDKLVAAQDSEFNVFMIG